MNVKSLKELYLLLRPAFKVKLRLAKYYDIDINEEDIWNYLSYNVWKKSINLQISEMVNDIIQVDLHKINNLKMEEIA